MEWVEVTAKTVEEAKDRALDRLGVDERDAEFEILEEPRQGFLGRMKGEARVRARVRPTAPRPKVERRDRRRGRRGDGDRERSPREGAAGTTTAAAAVTADTGREEATGEEEGAPAAPERTSEEPSEAERPRRKRRRSGPRGEGGRTERAGEAGEADDDERGAPVADLSIESQAEIVVNFLDGLLDAFGIEATTSWSAVDDENAQVRVDGEGLGLLVGPKGNTLSALSELARSVVVHAADGPPPGRVHLDVAGYRERRREALVRFTNGIADQVRESGRPVALEPMSSADRKIVHDTVNELDGVASTSEGDEPYRRVVILPRS